ncbi:MAG: MMPL family transporter, partial [bacterium]|nr:MMPL family transporter [bacterium]
MNNFFKSMAQFIVHFPILIISTTILVLIFLGFGITRITMDSDLTDDIPSTIPEKAFYDEVGKIFPVDDALIIAITDEKGVYSPRSLAQVFEWTERIKSVEDVKSVLSLSNASLITGTEDGIVIENAMQFLPETPADIAAFRERMEGNEMGKTLIGRDGKASAMMIAISPEADTKNRPRYIVSSPKGTTEEDLVIIYQKILGLKNPEGIPLVNRIYSGKYEEDRFTAAGSYNEPIGIDEKGNIITLVTPAKNVDTEGLLKRITNITESSGSKVVFTNSQVSMYDRMNSVAAMLPQYTQGEIYISGSKAVSSVIGNLMIADLSLLFPIVICIIIVILFLSFRTLRGVLLPLTNVLMATIMAMGFMGWANQPISMATMILPIILIAVGTAYAIHVLNRYYEELANEEDKKKAIVSAIEHVAVPTILAALTTMIGFASLAISSITALKVYGLLAALGILFALILAVSFTPAILVLLKKPSPKTVENHKGSILSTILDSTGKIISHNPRKVLITCLGIIIIAATGIPKIIFE